MPGHTDRHYWVPGDVVTLWNLSITRRESTVREPSDAIVSIIRNSREFNRPQKDGDQDGICRELEKMNKSLKLLARTLATGRQLVDTLVNESR